ncbi:MAG: hypothetical protein M3068_01505 [Gemmatimonadota bacterium]|nr:hypothetical protein [Gemmatimonadota bacterium]
MFGCLQRIGCLALVVVAAAVGWLAYTKGYFRFGSANTAVPAVAGGIVWEPLTPEGAARARDAVSRLSSVGGPVFQSVKPGDLSAYIFQELSKQLPPSAEHLEAAVIDGALNVRASVQLRDFGGASALGPLGSMLGDREPVQFGGVLEVVRPGLAQYRVTNLRIHDLSIPSVMIPRLVRAIERGSRPEGISETGLPLVVPRYIGDIRAQPGRITLYKTGSR